MIDLVEAGQDALSHAIATWRRRIVDPPRSTWQDPAWTESRHAIDTMIRSADFGLGWSRCSALVKAYRRDGDYEWCGAFAAWCWRAAGLDADLARVYWSSTYRLDKYARGKIAFGTPGELALRRRLPATERGCLVVRPETTLLEVEAWGPRAGDVLLVDTTGAWGYGHHVTIVDRVVGTVAHTIEGNATGTGHDGTTYQGVVAQRRKMHTWRRFIRPAPGDLTERQGA